LIIYRLYSKKRNKFFTQVKNRYCHYSAEGRFFIEEQLTEIIRVIKKYDEKELKDLTKEMYRVKKL